MIGRGCQPPDREMIGRGCQPSGREMIGWLGRIADLTAIDRGNFGLWQKRI
ncbi:MAG: hypothetical protein ACOX5F_02520 [Anaerovoracaceae bacterium]